MIETTLKDGQNVYWIDEEGVKTLIGQTSLDKFKPDVWSLKLGGQTLVDDVLVPVQVEESKHG